jgi:hypothetical protein
MAQLGDLVRATVLLRSAARAVGPKAGLARARSRPAISLRRALSPPSPIHVANSLIASFRSSQALRAGTAEPTQADRDLDALG